jgi:hypothetical protein
MFVPPPPPGGDDIIIGLLTIDGGGDNDDPEVNASPVREESPATRSDKVSRAGDAGILCRFSRRRRGSTDGRFCPSRPAAEDNKEVVVLTLSDSKSFWVGCLLLLPPDPALSPQPPPSPAPNVADEPELGDLSSSAKRSLNKSARRGCFGGEAPLLRGYVM